MKRAPAHTIPLTNHLGAARLEAWSLTVARLSIAVAQGAPSPFPQLQALSKSANATEVLHIISDSSDAGLTRLNDILMLADQGLDLSAQEDVTAELETAAQMLQDAMSTVIESLPVKYREMAHGVTKAGRAWLDNGTPVEVVAMDFEHRLGYVKAPNGDINAGPDAAGEMKLVPQLVRVSG